MSTRDTPSHELSHERQTGTDLISNSGVTAHEHPPAVLPASARGVGETSPNADDVGVEASSQGALDRFTKTQCLDFMTEWRRCISAFNQFHQYYIHGNFSRCHEEKARMYACFKWKMSGKEAAKQSLLTSLEQEQKNMLPPEPVWEMRKSPPSDW